MPHRLRTRVADFVRYDQQTGELWLLDVGRESLDVVKIETADQAVVVLAALAVCDPQLHSLAALHVLALTAHNWQGRPTDAQRGALSQAVVQLHSAETPLANSLLAEAHALADAALVEGAAAEAAVLAFVAPRLRQTDRAAERCGRHAAGLISEGDRVLVAGLPDVQGLALLNTLRWASEAHAVVMAGQNVAADLLLVQALAVQHDGTALVQRGVGAVIEQVRRDGIPCYLLAPHGPDNDSQLWQDLGVDVVGPELLNAIATDRGIYRPAMLARYNDEGEAPLDVIPLIG